MFVRQTRGRTFHSYQKDPTHKNLPANDSNDRFSSFETPPPSDEELEEFSDFDNTPKGPRPSQKQQIQKKEKSYILVEQLPLSCEEKVSGQTIKKRDQMDGEKVRAGTKGKKNRLFAEQSSGMKENSGSRFNYLSSGQQGLSTIKEDWRQQIRSSAFSSELSNQAGVGGFQPHYSSLTASLPKYRYYQDLVQAQVQYASLVQMEEARLLSQQLRIRNNLLQKENVSLRSRVFQLESILKQKQSFARPYSCEPQKEDEALLSSRKEAKQKLLDEIASVQQRCKEMKQEMKTEQEHQYSKLKEENLELRQQNVMLAERQDYNAKFVDVFLNMAYKLPLKVKPEWSAKKVIAMGWKVVKHLVKKALKLGIPPPTIVDSADNN